MIFNKLPFELVVYLVEYLSLRELYLFLRLCNKKLTEFGYSSEIWRFHLNLNNESTVKYLIRYHQSNLQHAELLWYYVAKDLIGMSNLSILHWRQPLYETREDFFPAQEAHSSLLFHDAFFVSFGGWGPFGNSIDLYDIRNLPKVHKFLSVGDLGDPFIYGFSTVKVDENSALIFGGCTMGGYRGGVNDLKLFTFLPFTDEEFTLLDSNPQYKLEPQIQQHFSLSCIRYDTSTCMPAGRGYHSAVMIVFNNARSMVIFGGLQDGAGPQNSTSPVQKLEMYNIEYQTWSQAHATGTEPSARFGHSCVYHARTDCMIFTGGSNGSDLFRNGIDLDDMHLLKIVRSLDSTSSDSLVWSQPLIDPAQRRLIPGRCHSICLASSDMMLAFGGSADSSNRVVVINLSNIRRYPFDGDSISLFKPECRGPSPSPRTSCTGILTGKYYLMQGGFHFQERELGDAWMLDLSYFTASYRGQIHEFNAVESTTSNATSFDRMSYEGNDYDDDPQHGYNNEECILS